ncbi:MAG: Hsp70 family protein [Deltaproteobacteria bacterium]|jgi:molecular chaperone DnaK|nr:Hsp70 family protein [Deltaproteobacteria bacterium]
MKHYIGIDLGTTNSVIASFDGLAARIWKNPDQKEITPSAIYIDRRGRKYIGQRAYDAAPHSPDHSALLFKRLMGTSTPVKLAAVEKTLTPQECSAEIIKVLFSYLPEEIQSDDRTAAVLTVPAAFNQMQKEATQKAAALAGLQKIALMQEPVAAVMSVMRAGPIDGLFLIYDLGGGTLDIALAEALGGRVKLLAHGGLAFCGGRDFDRILVQSLVRKWLHDNFSLPEDLAVNPKFKALNRLAAWAAEKAKIELSSKNETAISLAESEARALDLKGTEIYLDIPLSRTLYDSLIARQINESVEAALETLDKAGLKPGELEKVVFIGGPTSYKPLRDKVAFELGIKGSSEVNPMTAVAEGASVLAESVDWDSPKRGLKGVRRKHSSKGRLPLVFRYPDRTTEARAGIILTLANPPKGAEFQVDSSDTGWTSGRKPLAESSEVAVSLAKYGANTFKVFVFEASGQALPLNEDRLVITRARVSVESIPASHSLSIEVLEKPDGKSNLDFLVRAGESLPKKGRKIFHAAESLRAGQDTSLNFNIWEGEIENPITDNRAIGVLKISGEDFKDSAIPVGADLVCDYEILDSGHIHLEISVPCIHGTFGSGRNFYSPQEGQIDFTTASLRVAEEAHKTSERIELINRLIFEPKLEEARRKLTSALNLKPEETETEKAQEAMENVYAARRILAKVRKDHQKEIRRIDLASAVQCFERYNRDKAGENEAAAFDLMVGEAQKSIELDDQNFERHFGRLMDRNFRILWRQDWYVIDNFNRLMASPHLFVDQKDFESLIEKGRLLVKNDNIKELRSIVSQLALRQIRPAADAEILNPANIVKA